jgi:hypothetical protein
MINARSVGATEDLEARPPVIPPNKHWAGRPTPTEVRRVSASGLTTTNPSESTVIKRSQRFWSAGPSQAGCATDCDEPDRGAGDHQTCQADVADAFSFDGSGEGNSGRRE